MSMIAPPGFLLLLLLAGPMASAHAQSAAPSLEWVRADSAARTVHLSLEVSRPAGSPSATLNGYREGAAQVIVPLGWTVVWDWHSADSTEPHSLVVMAEREKLPTEGGRPAFTNAMTRSLTAGLAPGQSDRTTFEAEEAGWYWLLCGVANHAIVGEWIEMRVDAEAEGAGLKLRER